MNSLPPAVSAPHPLRVDAVSAALLLVDFQERLAAAMPAEAVAACARNALVLIALARRLRVPVVVSEQHPKGLGATVPALLAALADPGLTLARVEKVDFSCAASPAFADIHRRLDRRQWILIGMETHVCVYQTARDLVAAGAQVHVPADAVLSRSAANVRIGLDLMARAGAVITSTETVVFDALRCAGTDDFRALSKLVR